MTQWNAPEGQGEYGRPGYGDAGYGQQPGAAGGPGEPGYAYGQPYEQPSAFERSRSYGIVGTVLTLLGGIAVLVSFTALDWYRGSTFSDLRSATDNNPNAEGFATAYFGWLGWVALIVVVVAGVLASFPTPALRICRIVGIVVGVAMAGLTFLAIDFSGDSTGYSEYLKNAQIGFYFAVAGFLVAGIGAGIGPRRG